jgi:hypothetical protein
MIRPALLLLMLVVSCHVVAQQPEPRVMSLITQDMNGLYIFMAVASSDDVRASASQLGVGKGGKANPVRYPRKLFDELWEEAKSLELSEYISKSERSDEDVGASKNYIISIGYGPDGDTYHVPKCSAPPAIVLFLKRLTNNMLPAGSPGLYEACSVGEGDAG